MEIFRLENTKYSVICSECKNILKFKINPDKFNISGECKNNHTFKNISFYSFKNDFIKNTSLIKLTKCYKCFKNHESKSFLCQTCNKLFCYFCKNQHLKEEKHSKIKYYINNKKICPKHDKSFYFYCNDCNCYICESCKIEHINHITTSLLDIFPTNEKKESIQKKTLIFEEKIKRLKEILNKRQNEINKKFESIENYLSFVLEINDTLFKKYNYSIFDIHNYENFNYIYNFINNEKIIEEKNYLDYIFFNISLKENENKEIIKNNNEKAKIILNNNNLENLLYKDYSKLKYFKDNLFYEIESNNKYSDNYIKLYEFIDFSFKEITLYNLNFFPKLLSINKAKYGDYFLINYEMKKNIKFLEYNSKIKEFNLSKKEIKSSKGGYFDKNFKDAIDCKNESILTIDEDGLNLWEKSNKKFYNKKYFFPKIYYQLFSIDDKTIFTKEYGFITFFKIEKLEPIKACEFDGSIDFASTINNKLLFLKNSEKYILICLKYFNIIQIIEISDRKYPLKIINNYLIQYSIKNNKIIITKEVFNEKKGFFIKEKITELDIESCLYPKILITDNNNLFVGKKGSISIFTEFI